MNDITPTIWRGCYEDNWKGFLADASMAHPAKFSKALIERIYDHLLGEAYICQGDIVGDCFGGIASGAIVAAYRGLHHISVELEPRFVALAQENIRLHAGRLKALGCLMPVFIQGDSRRFHEIIGPAVSAIITSPPYADSIRNQESGIDMSKLRGNKSGRKSQAAAGTVMQYGDTQGQVGALKAGDLDAVVCSPPYLGGGHHPDQTGAWNKNGRGQGGTEEMAGYGKTAGQLGQANKETYWEACAAIYSSCRLALKPQGIIVLVVKDYCQAGKRVRLCDDTARLLEHCGFEIVERIHAMLVSETHENDLFAGTTVKKTARKSFFRRIYEAKVPEGDERRIDYEEVLIARSCPLQNNLK